MKEISTTKCAHISVWKFGGIAR